MTGITITTARFSQKVRGKGECGLCGRRVEVNQEVNSGVTTLSRCPSSIAGRASITLILMRHAVGLQMFSAVHMLNHHRVFNGVRDPKDGARCSPISSSPPKIQILFTSVSRENMDKGLVPSPMVLIPSSCLADY